jgi:hypothetical protein
MPVSITFTDPNTAQPIIGPTIPVGGTYSFTFDTPPRAKADTLTMRVYLLRPTETPGTFEELDYDDAVLDNNAWSAELTCPGRQQNLTIRATLTDGNTPYSEDLPNVNVEANGGVGPIEGFEIGSKTGAKAKAIETAEHVAKRAKARGLPTRIPRRYTYVLDIRLLNICEIWGFFVSTAPGRPLLSAPVRGILDHDAREATFDFNLRRALGHNVGKFHFRILQTSGVMPLWVDPEEFEVEA